MNSPIAGHIVGFAEIGILEIPEHRVNDNGFG
jgi:hypothetical protein